MSKRKSVEAEGYKRSKNPIASACLKGDLLVSGLINGTDPATGKLPPTLEEQCKQVFQHMRKLAEGGGATTDDIVKVNVWMDRSQRAALDREWLKMFPDENSRPARHTMPRGEEGDILIECDFTAVVDHNT